MPLFTVGSHGREIPEMISPRRYLLLQKVGHSDPLLLGDGGQELVGRAEVPPHDGRLVLQHGEQQGVADDVQLLVSQVETVVLGDVAQQIHGPACREEEEDV